MPPDDEGTGSAEPALERSRRVTTRALKERAFSGVLWLGGGRLLAQTMHLVTRIALARLLPPEAFGLVAMASVVSAFVDLLAGQGIGGAVVQAEHMDDVKRSTAFWAAAAQGVALSVLALLLTPYVGAYFKVDEVVPVIEVLLIGSALLAPAAVFEGLLARGMEFRSAAVRRIAANLVAAVLAIVLAYRGAGAWALVAQRLAAGALFFALAVWASPWKPGFSFSLQALRSLTPVSAGTSLSALLIGGSKQLPAILIGRALGVEALGFFALAQQVLSLPVQYVAGPVSRVLYSLFSRLQGSMDEFRSTFERGQAAVVLVAAVIPGLVGVLSPVAVPVLLGPRWEPAVLLLQILSVPATVRVGNSVVGAAVRSLGRPSLLLTFTSVPLLMSAVGLLGGLQYGLLGAVLGWAAASLVGLAYSLIIVSRTIGVSVRAQLRPLKSALPAVAGLVAVAQGLLCLLAAVPGVPRLGVAAAAGTLTYAALVRATAPGDWRWMVTRARQLPRRTLSGLSP